MSLRSHRLTGSLLLAATLAGAGVLKARIPTGLVDGFEDLHEHEEALFKRNHAAAREILRAGERRTLAAPAEGDARGVDVLSYDISFTLDPAVRFLEGTTVIRVSGTAATTTALALDFDDSYTLLDVSRDGLPIVPISFAGSQLVLPLTPPVKREGRATLSIHYRGVPPSYSALSFWKHASAYAVSSVAEPFGARTFWPCVDEPSDRALTTVHATVPDGYVVASAGTVTSSAPNSGKTTFTWRLPQPISTYLVSLNVANFETLSDSYVSRDGTSEMPITSYILPEHREINRARHADFRNQIAVQASLFGEYPYLDTKYGIVESAFSGGMEHPTMTAIGTDQLGNAGRDLTILFVHELTHMWWGDRVTMRSWDDLWLNEGFATYGEVLYRERTTAGLNPGVLLSRSYDDGLYAGALGHSVVAPVANPFRYSGAVYQKGAYVLHMLRRRVGDELFFSTLRDYGSHFANGNASRGDLRAEFERSSGRDLKAFFDQWLETPYRPVLRATYENRTDGSVRIALGQTQTHVVVHPEADPADVPFYRFPLTLRLFFDGGATRDERVEVEGRDSRFDFAGLPGHKVTGIVLDPDGDLLKSVESTGPA